MALRVVGAHDGGRQISFNKDPISAFLIICDELQEGRRLSWAGDVYTTKDHLKPNLTDNDPTPNIEAVIFYKESQVNRQETLQYLSGLWEVI